MRASLLLLLRLLLLLLQQQQTESVDNTPSSSLAELSRVPRVVGGHRSVVGQEPYIVNIRRRGVFQCGGSLVTPRCVLTAAHCVRDSHPADFVVRGGVTFLHETRNARQVRQIRQPRSYNKQTLDQDVALLQLREPLQGPSIDSISLSRRPLRAGSMVRVSGWGLTDERSKQLPNQLHSVQLRVLPRSECERRYRGYRNITAAMYCASVPGFKDACAADSGGPAVDVNGQLVGIVSWGKANSCAHELRPGVYTNVSHMYNWIAETMRRHCY